MLAEESHAEGMECRKRDELCLIGLHGGAYTLAHLLGSLVGEGHREDRCRIDTLSHKPGDAGRKDASLPSAGTSKDKHRPLRMGGGTELLGVEIKESETGHKKKRMRDEGCTLKRRSEAEINLEIRKSGIGNEKDHVKNSTSPLHLRIQSSSSIP